MQVAFIGLGRMGQVIARRVLEAGHDVTLFNRTVDKLAELVGSGAKMAATVAEACRFSGVVLSMLADDDALNAVSRDPGGILESLPPGGIHVAMGTHQMGTIKALADSHAEVGQVLVAAPVLGSPPVVLAGRSAFIVAGPPDAVSRIRPLLAEIGRRTFDAGPNQGSASLMKLANNFVLACAIETMGEAFSLVEKSGASPHAFREILTDGLFACVAYERYSQTIVERKWHEVNITATLGLKDVTLALAAGELVGVPLPSALVCRDRLQGAIAHGDSERDWSVMALEQSRASGLS